MDKGVDFVINNYLRAIELCDNNSQYKMYSRKIKAEYARAKEIPFTGNMIDFFTKFKVNKHKYADDFAFLEKYNILPNEKMSDYLLEHYPYESSNKKFIKDLLIGEIVSTGEMMSMFGVKYRGSFRKSSANNLIVIIADRKQNYNTMDENGVIYYRAMGDSFQYRESKSVYNYRKTNTKLYLFEAYRGNRFCFFGQVEFAKEPYIDNENRAFFAFKRVDNKERNIYDDVDYGMPNMSEESNNFWSLKTLDNKLYEKAIEFSKNPFAGKKHSKKAIEEANDRKQCIANFVKRRAEGKCDLCNQIAPFKKKDGVPFLECHHVIQIADDGPDTIYNAVALCPNCHRKVHILHSRKDNEVLITKIGDYLKKMSDVSFIDEYNQLFKDFLESVKVY